MSDTHQMQRVSVLVPSGTIARLDKIARLNAVRGWKRSDAIRNALADWVAQEDPDLPAEFVDPRLPEAP